MPFNDECNRAKLSSDTKWRWVSHGSNGRYVRPYRSSAIAQMNLRGEMRSCNFFFLVRDVVSLMTGRQVMRNEMPVTHTGLTKNSSLSI
jgi:hypothetical protein